MSLLRSLVIQPDIIFYAEPTNNLDEKNTNLILDIIRLAIDEKKQIIKNFYVDLPKGAVFINDDGRGNKLFDGLGTYIIKGISLPNNFGQGN